jgi:hypothetical protein
MGLSGGCLDLSRVGETQDREDRVDAAKKLERLGLEEQVLRMLLAYNVSTCLSGAETSGDQQALTASLSRFSNQTLVDLARFFAEQELVLSSDQQRTDPLLALTAAGQKVEGRENVYRFDNKYILAYQILDIKNFNDNILGPELTDEMMAVVQGLVCNKIAGSEVTKPNATQAGSKEINAYFKGGALLCDQTVKQQALDNKDFMRARNHEVSYTIEHFIKNKLEEGKIAADKVEAAKKLAEKLSHRDKKVIVFGGKDLDGEFDLSDVNSARQLHLQYTLAQVAHLHAFNRGQDRRGGIDRRNGTLQDINDRRSLFFDFDLEKMTDHLQQGRDWCYAAIFNDEGEVNDLFKPFMTERDGQWIVSPDTHNAFRKDKLEQLAAFDNLEQRVEFQFEGSTRSAKVGEVLFNLSCHTSTFDVLKKHYETENGSSFERYLAKIQRMVDLRDQLSAHVASASQGFVYRKNLASLIAQTYKELKGSIKADRDSVNQASFYALVEILIQEGLLLLLGVDHRFFGNLVKNDLEISLNKFLAAAVAKLRKIWVANDRGTGRVRNVDPKIHDAVGDIAGVIQEEIAIVIDGGDEAMVAAKLESFDQAEIEAKLRALSIDQKLRIFGVIIKGLGLTREQLPTSIENVSDEVRDAIAEIVRIKAYLGEQADALKPYEAPGLAGLSQPSVEVVNSLAAAA